VVYQLKFIIHVSGINDTPFEMLCDLHHVVCKISIYVNYLVEEGITNNCEETLYCVICEYISPD